MNKPFNLEAFKAGQPALTRDGKKAKYIGWCDAFKDRPLIAHIEGCNYILAYSLNGMQSLIMQTLVDLVAMVSRHQALIDSYDPEDTWQWACQGDTYWHYAKPPLWLEDRDYRIHPHNDLIKAYKKGANIQVLNDKGIFVDVAPFWNENKIYRIKPEPVIHCLAYDTNLADGKNWVAPVVIEKQIAIEKGWTIIQEWEV